MPAQQLVMNPSLEEYSDCPWTYGQILLADHWSDPNAGSPEYFNACAQDDFTGVPHNMRGYQSAHSGDAYAFIGCYIDEYTPNFREYIQGSLSEPLIAGGCYHVEAFLSMSDCDFATTHIGIWFTDTALSSIPDHYPLPVTPQIVYNGPPLSDTLNWTLMSGEFLSHGGEVAFIIGLFEDDTTAIFEEVYYTASYESGYYVDDVSVELVTDGSPPCGLSTDVLHGAAVQGISIHYDVANSTFAFDAPPGSVAVLNIFEATGRLIEQSTLVSGVKYDMSHLPTGVYLCELRGKGHESAAMVVRY